MSNAPNMVYLADYVPPQIHIPTVDLDITIHSSYCHVISCFKIDPQSTDRPLVLNGRDLTLVSIDINGTAVATSDFSIEDNKLILYHYPSTSFNLEIAVDIDPFTNKSLEGLYQSGDLLCTQNEPEGFRRITYFFDRPDILSRYTTTLRADSMQYPTLLANGNCIHRKELPDGFHETRWEDPFPKPCYLFAMVAGDLGKISDTFITQSKRTIELEIYCKKGLEDRCWHAMESLKVSMKWDEEVFGLEYDLDLFMIVAVDDFNAGAMENKGLNIFNSALIFADSETATDADYQRIEAVIAHEYFHNWTGNRVTCRDWFQLTLKEGLTVFRDEEFSADIHSRSVKRIDDVSILRMAQFAEDGSPMAHPIRPASYAEINNFYTSTVYNKGAEVIRMIHTLIGDASFKKGLRIYFERFDGQAVTTEDFISSMSEASDRDFSMFKRWYHQAGTPHCTINGHYDPSAQTFTLSVEQSCRPTPETTIKQPFVIPLKLGLLSHNGDALPFSHQTVSTPVTEMVLPLDHVQQDIVLTGVKSSPIPSLFRHFSAPVTFDYTYSTADLLTIIEFDSDLFNRFEACQMIYKQLIDSPDLEDLWSRFIPCISAVLTNDTLDPAFRSAVLNVPSFNELILHTSHIDPCAIFLARDHVISDLSRRLESVFDSIYMDYLDSLTHAHDSQTMAKRRLKNTCLAYLSRLETHRKKCLDTLETPICFTDEMAAFKGLVSESITLNQTVINQFRSKWHNEPLIIQKWMAVQAISRDAECLNVVQELQKDPLYQPHTPNFIRSLIGAFSQNILNFHANDGSGYRFLANQLLTIDSFNPSVAARLANGYKLLPKLAMPYKKEMASSLDQILDHSKLSVNTREVCHKIRSSIN